MPPLSQEVAARIDAAVDSCASDLAALARKIHANPELRFEEHKASEWLSDFVRSKGHTVERGIAAMPTAFRARSGRKGGPSVAILAEYDALPGVGHACGHNLIAAGGAGAFIAASTVAESLGGEVVRETRRKLGSSGGKSRNPCISFAGGEDEGFFVIRRSQVRFLSWL